MNRYTVNNFLFCVKKVKSGITLGHYDKKYNLFILKDK